jgi:murein DD-endopeptidase MepM/ murein hydrolase activator NlpD
MTWVTPENSPDPDPDLEPGQDPVQEPAEPAPPADDAPSVDSADAARPTPPLKSAGVVDETGELVGDALLNEEPPIDPLADTSPSVTIPPVEQDPAVEPDPDELPIWRSVVGLAILLLAAALTIVAGLIFVMPMLRESGEETTLPPTEAVVLPTDTPVEAASGGVPLAIVEPTLSADEIAARLAAPPMDLNPVDAPIARRDSPFTIVPERARAEVIAYTIEEGDTVEKIAEAFGLTKDTIAWSNDRQTVFALRPGNELYIMPVDGVFHQALIDQSIQSIADEYSVDPYDIINSEFNDLFGSTPESMIRSGTRMVVPGGSSTYNDWTFNPVVERSLGGGGSADAGYISFAPGQPGSCGRQPNPGGSGYFGQPLQSYSWVRGFTGYHTGVDLAASPGTGVLASSSGRVIYRGWNDWGYGYLIVLAHGPFTTFYAHLSQINVGCGQIVGAGQLIGGVGSTGNSSGPHLHFEVRYNDIPTDPLLYMGF